MPFNYNQYAAKGNEFIHQLAKELGDEKDRSKAKRILSATLHVLRDLLPTEESVQLLSQLPMFLKATYVDKWKISGEKKKIKNTEAFLKQVQKYEGFTYGHDFENDEELENAVIVVFLVLRKYISLGELEDIRSVVPKELKYLLSNNIMI